MARPDPAEPRWFEPLHVRDPRAARQRVASQVAGGADVVVAPTWQSHRRALLASGETRQARAWTSAAVRIGREAIEAGLERRDEAEAAGPEPPTEDVDAPGLPAVPTRPDPLLAATLPALDEAPEPGGGRLLPRQAASERDYRDQAGLLADAEPDLLLVEGQLTPGEVRTAVEAALETGLTVWVALSASDLAGSAGAQLMDTIGDLSVACVLLPGTPRSGPDGGPPDWGGLLDEGPVTEAWLDAGATVLGLLDGATPARLAPVRATIDELERAVLDVAREADDAWWAHVRRAASMAEGGAALWLRDPAQEPPPRGRLPDGFTWIVARADEAGALPSDRFSLIVDAHDGPAVTRGYRRWLALGGVLASRGLTPSVGGTDLRTIAIDETHDPPFVIARRED